MMVKIKPSEEQVSNFHTTEKKKKRNLPGMPDPEAEVLALSPKTLLATNRFVCEICNKGFQRDQNLQLHRRGHNLPWKLRQRSSNEVIKKRVYVCPEPSCIHHDPSRALGDLTGIKKHFSRKHGEKKYKCERCTKRYAVQSDWKAHVKGCGTREYRCDCGTLFSRRDSFVTHRAFCDALAQETARSQPLVATSSGGGDLKVEDVASEKAPSSPLQPLTPSTGVLSPVLSIQSSATELPENQTAHLQPPPGPPPPLPTSVASAASATATTTVTASISSTSSSNLPGNTGLFASTFNGPTPTEVSQQPSHFSSLLRAMTESSSHRAIDPISLSLSSSLYGTPPSLFPASSQSTQQHHYALSPQPAALSATALLQKAAQMGATSSNSSFLRGLGLSMPTPSDRQDNASTMTPSTSSTPSHWNNNTPVKIENNSLPSSLGLGIPTSGLMMGQTTLFGSKPATLDFLGLGMQVGEVTSTGFPAFFSSIDGGMDMTGARFSRVGSSGDTWDDPSDKKPSLL